LGELFAVDVVQNTYCRQDHGMTAQVGEHDYGRDLEVEGDAWLTAVRYGDHIAGLFIRNEATPGMATTSMSCVLELQFPHRTGTANWIWYLLS
jgi:hypothetical protein